MIRQPAPKPDVMARRDSIVAGLRALLPESGLIAEPLRLKPYETDGLSAYRQVPARGRAAGDHRTGRRRPALLPPERRAGHPARRRHVAVRRRAADGGRGRRRHDADEPDPRHQLPRPLRRGAGRRHQYRHHQRGLRRRLLLCARPIQPARLHDRRQRQHELRRRPLPEIRGHRQQSAGPEDRHHRRRNHRHRRRSPRRRRLRLARPADRQRGHARHRHRGHRAHPARPRRRAGHARGLQLQRDRRRLRRRHHLLRHHPGGAGVHGPPGDPRLRGVRPCRLPARRRSHADHRGRGQRRGTGPAAWPACRRSATSSTRSA